MFTGIIEATATVLNTSSTGLTIERPALFDDIKIGSSISVSGVCLSVVELRSSSMRFDVVEETWKKTKLAELKKGDRVNLERSMKASDRIEGHIVQGHVEGVGTVNSVKRKEKSTEIIFHFSLLSFHSIVPKGSIAIDGVSLTVADVHDQSVTIALIPHTVENTTLGSLKKGDHVNIETDVMVRAARSGYSDSSHAH
ncbi:MAG: riboflavin synthase [Candidatus Peribacteraceae bacterium]|nr:riboflavin synthase [Candidatus Peribacteraceae bacterium]